MGRAHPSPARSRVPLHRRVATSPRALGRWALVVALAVLLASVVDAALGDANEARRRWGDTVPVLVTARPIDPGQHLADAVTVVDWPVGLVPAGTLRSPDDLAEGAVAAAPRAAGEPVTAAALAPSGDRARPLVALPTTAARPELSPGDRVAVWATYDPSLAGGRPTTSAVVDGAVVVSVRDDAVVIAVDPAAVGAVVEATALATVTVVSERR